MRTGNTRLNLDFRQQASFLLLISALLTVLPPASRCGSPATSSLSTATAASPVPSTPMLNQLEVAAQNAQTVHDRLTVPTDGEALNAQVRDRTQRRRALS